MEAKPGGIFPTLPLPLCLFPFPFYFVVILSHFFLEQLLIASPCSLLGCHNAWTRFVDSSDGHFMHCSK